MTALAANRDTQKMGLSAICDAYEVPVKNAVKLYAGAIVVGDAGYAAPGRTATGLIALGRCEREYDLSTSNGQFKVFARPGIYKFANSSAGDLIAQTDLGADCFIVDDQTVAKTNGSSTRSRAGKIIGVDSDGGVWVQLGNGI